MNVSLKIIYYFKIKIIIINEKNSLNSVSVNLILWCRYYKEYYAIFLWIIFQTFVCKNVYYRPISYYTFWFYYLDLENN